MDGRTLTEIWQLPTTHLFHCIKMLFNHLAAVHGGFPVHFTREYEDYLLEAEDEQGAQQMAALVCFFIAEIEYRKDLHPKHWPVYLMQSVLNLRTTAPPR